MINEVIINRLDELIGDYDTPFFNYLLYSYDLSLNECELIIEELKSDIDSNKFVSDNIVATLDDYFNRRVTSLEKQDKIEYLSKLFQKDSPFYITVKFFSFSFPLQVFRMWRMNIRARNCKKSRVSITPESWTRRRFMSS